MFFNLFNAASNSDLLSSAVSGSDAEQAIDLGFKFEPDNFLQALPTIGVFMLSIFVVMALIIIVTALINKIGNGKPKADDAQ